MDDKSVTQGETWFVGNAIKDALQLGPYTRDDLDRVAAAAIGAADYCRRTRPDNRAALRDAVRRFVADYDDGDRADAGNGPLMEAHVAEFRAALSSDHSRGLEEDDVERVMYADEWSLHGLGFDSHTGGFSNVIARPRGSKDRADEIVFTKAEILAALGQAK